jgi:hypothetical protein
MVHKQLIIGLLIALSGGLQAAPLRFAPRELFRVPFGTQREALGTRVEDGNFQYPRDFTLDGAGRFYIYDIKKNRIARYSPQGKYEIGFAYPPTAGQIFAHADSQDNLWLLIGDPIRGLYYGIYDPHGRRLKDGLFSQYNQFRLHLNDEQILHIVAQPKSAGVAAHTYIFHEPSLLMKKINMAPPPENHRVLKKNEKMYFIDAIPSANHKGASTTQRITDESRRPIADIKGDVVYITGQGEIYTRVGDCEINVYEAGGAFKGKVMLIGLPSECRAVRFDPEGNIYQLDGIPNESHQYTPQMPGMRLLRWERTGS